MLLILLFFLFRLHLLFWNSVLSNTVLHAFMYSVWVFQLYMALYGLICAEHTFKIQSSCRVIVQADQVDCSFFHSQSSSNVDQLQNIWLLIAGVMHYLDVYAVIPWKEVQCTITAEFWQLFYTVYSRNFLKNDTNYTHQCVHSLWPYCVHMASCLVSIPQTL